MNDPIISRKHRPRRGEAEDADNPAAAALTELLTSERETAREADPSLLATQDPGKVWLLWFAIGATAEICRITQSDADDHRNGLFRQVVGLIFDGNGSSPTVPDLAPGADKHWIDVFEMAGASAVQACMRGQPTLGYYVAALRELATASGAGEPN